MPSVDEVVATLGLARHPEGGWYREVWRSALQVDTPRGPRAAGTHIHFLLEGGSFSAWHRVLGADEVWHLYDGDDLELHELTDDGEHRVRVLSASPARDARVRVVSAGVWQAARVVAGGRWSLCGCTVTPGFTFGDFELPDRDALLARFPDRRDLVVALTRAP